MKTDSELLLQRGLEGAGGCHRLQCGTDGPGAQVVLTLTVCGDLCSRTGKTETHRKAEAVTPRIGKI